MRLVVVDYGAGNLPSVVKALRRLGADPEVSSDPAAVAAASALVIPGVGAFPAAMAELGRRGLVEPIREAVRQGKPVLGICVGLQVLFDEGEEFTPTPGLGVVPGRVTRLPDGVKLPHMGWNQVRWAYPHPLVQGIPDGTWFYFVHSFAAEAGDPADVLGVTEYGRPFPAAVARGNVAAVQFHPEKSSAAGLQLLANWLDLARAWPGFTLWPAIDLKDGRAVRLVQGRFDQVTDYGDPVAAAQRWLAAGARALHVVDLDGALAGRPVNTAAVRAIAAAARAAGARVEVGGGLRTLEAIGEALDAGASRVVVGTGALSPDFMRAAVARFGPERVVAGIDARDGRVAVRGWLDVTEVQAVDLARELRRLGVRHCVYTDIRRDGTLAGPNWEGLAAMAATGLLVVASGGVRSVDDVRRCRATPGVVGAIAGKALYAGTLDLKEALAAC